MDLNDEYFLKDAIIRFPRQSPKERAQVKLDEHLNEHSTQTEVFQGDNVDFTGTGNGMVLPTPATISPKTTIPRDVDKKSEISSGKTHKIGEIPKYLIQRKKELAHAQTMVNEAPVGHYLLTEEERQEALNIAQARYDHLINQLNALSITSQTMKTKTKKIDIERELQSLDNTLKIFSRNKVFVNLGE